MDEEQGHQQAVATSASRRELMESMAKHADAIERLAVKMIDLEVCLEIHIDSCVSTHISTIREHASDLKSDMIADVGGLEDP